ncbi:MAG: Fe(2+)-trafficking protein [Planctomycetota bacterium]|jgi:Fe-S cluster biosynthesis and repair protein YggX
MTVEDPSNAMGWFSLGNAYLQAEREEEAARSYRKAIEQDETFSRAYQSLGQILVEVGANEQAADILTKGYEVAATRGDLMPKNAIAELLEKIDQPIPEVEIPNAEPVEVSADMVFDIRTGQPGPRLPKPPLNDAVGRFIYDHYSQPTWREWIGQGTKVINEMRLDLSKLDHQAAYDTQMMDWLGFSMQQVEEHTKNTGA